MARGAVNSAGNVARTKQMIRRAFETQLAGAGFSFVEILTMCPTGWFIETAEAPGLPGRQPRRRAHRRGAQRRAGRQRPRGEAVRLGRNSLVLCSGTLGATRASANGWRWRPPPGSTPSRCGAATIDRAQSEGHSDDEMRTMLADHGLVVAEVDPAWWWTPGAPDDRAQPGRASTLWTSFATARTSCWPWRKLVGARSLNAAEVLGGTWGIEEGAQAFAALCDRAAEHGLLVHLEWLAWSRVPDVSTALEVVRRAGRPNGGLNVDTWHCARTGTTPDDLRALPGDGCSAIQLSDVPCAAEENMIDETLHRRRCPGRASSTSPATCSALRTPGCAAPSGSRSSPTSCTPPEQLTRHGAAARDHPPGSRRRGVGPHREQRSEADPARLSGRSSWAPGSAATPTCAPCATPASRCGAWWDATPPGRPSGPPHVRGPRGLRHAHRGARRSPAWTPSPSPPRPTPTPSSPWRPSPPGRTCCARSRSPATLPEGRAVLDAAEGAGIVHLLGTEFRFDAGQALLAQAVRDDLVGAPRMATWIMHVPMLADRRRWCRRGGPTRPQGAAGSGRTAPSSSTRSGPPWVTSRG